MRERPNTTQRTWDNYVGDSPIERYRGTDYYKRSPRYSADGDPGQVPEGYDMDSETGKLKRRKSLLREAKDALLGAQPLQQEYDPGTFLT